MHQSEQDMAQICDTTLKTILRTHPETAIAFVNEVFRESYGLDSEVELPDQGYYFRWDHGPDGSMFKIRNAGYHLACQCSSDDTLASRALMHDTLYLLKKTIGLDTSPVLELPRTCIIQLCPTHDMPDEVTTSIQYQDTQNLLYKTKVLRAFDYDLDDIFEKHLFLLVPFHLMRYDSCMLEEIAHDVDLTRGLVAECADIRRRLEREVAAEGMETLHRDLVEHLVTISEHLLADHDDLRLKVMEAMGEDHIEMMDEKVERLVRERDEAVRKHKEAKRLMDEFQSKYDALQRTILQAIIDPNDKSDESTLTHDRIKILNSVGLLGLRRV